MPLLGFTIWLGSDLLQSQDVLSGAQCLLAHHTSKKEQLVNSKALSMAVLYDIRSVLICLLAFAAFLNCSLSLVKPINTGTVHGLL